MFGLVEKINFNKLKTNGSSVYDSMLLFSGVNCISFSVSFKLIKTVGISLLLN